MHPWHALGHAYRRQKKQRTCARVASIVQGGGGVGNEGWAISLAWRRLWLAVLQVRDNYSMIEKLTTRDRV